MKEVKVSIRPTDVKGVQYDNSFKMANGTTTKMRVNANVGVKLNPAQPTTAIVMCKFEAGDEEGSMKFALETVTAVSVDTFVDNLDEFIKKNYMNCVMLSINEKIRTVASTLGLNIAIPPVNFVYAGDGVPGAPANVSDNIVSFDAGKK